MAKTKVSEWSSTASSNTDIDSINIAEGCAPSGINDAIRELMSQIKDFQAGTYADSFNGPVGTTTAAAGAFTTLTASSTATLNTLASSGATLTGGSINNMAIGASTASSGAFTTLAASGAVTLSGGTANGVAYLNGSKVLTTGSALTYSGTTLTSSVPTNASLQNGLSVTNATNADLNVRIANNLTDLQVSSATPLSFTLGASEQMRLTSTGLGIGTSSPAEKLSMYDAAALGLRMDSPDSIIRFMQGATTKGYVRMIGGTTNRLQLVNNSNELTLDSSGNLGLGVTPSAWNSSFRALDISSYGGIYSYTSGQYTGFLNNAYFGSGGFTYKNNFYATMYTSGDSGAHKWFTAPSGTAGDAITFTQAMTLDASGNLLVGKTSSAYNTAGMELSPTRATFTTDGVAVARLNRKTSDGAIIDFYKDTVQQGAIGSASGGLYFGTGSSGTERARIDSSGNLLVGTTSQFASGKECIAFNGASFAGLAIKETAAGAGTFVNFVNSSGSTIGQINQNGSSAVSYNTSSDYRLKHDIQPMTGALAKVQQLKPCTYKWNADGSDGEGFIAHELAEVVPQCVTGEKDAVDEDGNPVYQGIDTSFLIATLTAAIQEQQAIIEQLKARLDAANL